jgi:6-phosphogluconolactonase
LKFPHDISLVVDAGWPERVIELWAEIEPHAVVIPGGKTPIPLFDALGDVALKLRLEEAEFFFSDERCVPVSHRDSNFGSAYRHLFCRVFTTVHRMPSETCNPESYASLLERRQIDLALLGVGTDGHTASIFDGSPARDFVGEDDPLVTVVERDDHRRLTLTPKALRGSRVVAFLVSGKHKATVAERLAHRDPSLVASAVFGREATYLVCDPEAASELNF